MEFYFVLLSSVKPVKGSGDTDAVYACSIRESTPIGAAGFDVLYA